MQKSENLSKKHLQKLLKTCLIVLRKYDWLLDSYVLDFYVDDHWSKLPPSWRILFEKIKPEKLSELISSQKNLENYLWPLELLAVKQLLKNLCIIREQNAQIKLEKISLLQHPKLKYIFTKSVKLKKLHEIQHMSLICKESVCKTKADFVIDFGAGLGHLARVLGYAYGIRVCCLEMQEELNKNAELINLKLESMAAKHLTAEEMANFQRPTHLTLCLNSKMQESEFLKIIKTALQLENDNFSFGIIGLHPCGDLGPILMRLFLSCRNAKFLNFVGCCYMKLTTKTADKSDSTVTNGYPLSCFLSEQPIDFTNLSYEAREISCHAIEMYYDRLVSNDYEHLKVHSYRAAAERIIVKHFPALKHSGLKSVKYVPGMQFEDYFNKAVHGTHVDISVTELDHYVAHIDLLHWHRIVVFYTLRLLLAPLVESIILYDRILYLIENGCQVDIQAIFDARLSPRNHITAVIK